ncbi:MAG: response regulator transcription factor [Actinomycetota bacterium]
MTIKVLIVDDTDHVREMLAQMLMLDGFDVVGKAGGAEEGIELARTKTPDIVIMDYKMPEMDGVTATKRIRMHSPTIPVILYTAYLDQDLERKAADAGVSACIGKIEGLASLEREISALCLELAEH